MDYKDERELGSSVSLINFGNTGFDQAFNYYLKDELGSSFFLMESEGEQLFCKLRRPVTKFYCLHDKNKLLEPVEMKKYNGHKKRGKGM